MEFIRRFIAGDTHIRQEFHAKYSRLIYNYIYHILKIKGKEVSPDEVDELYQSFFAFILEDDCRRLKTFKGKNGCKFASWLRQVVINFTRDYLRSKKEVVSLDEKVDDEPSLMDTLQDKSAVPGEFVLRQELLDALEECFDKLTSQEKYFLELNFYQKVQLEVLKDLWKISRAAIDMRKQRILNKLKECFATKGFFKLD